MRQIRHLQIGKNGLSPAFIEQAKKMFETAKIVKVSFLKSATRDRDEAKEMANKLILALGPNYKYVLIGYTMTIRRSAMQTPKGNKFQEKAKESK